MYRSRNFSILFVLGIFILSLVYFGQSPQVASAQDDARVQIVHLAPFAAGEGSSVTVSVGGEILTDFLYGDSTAYLSLSPGSYLIEITPTGSMDPALSVTLELEAGVDYTAVAVGDIENQPLELLALVDDNTAPADGSFKLRLGHLAPFAADLDDTLADVRRQDGTAVLEGVTFGDVANYLELPAGIYDLKITTPGGETTLIDPAPVSFNSGDIISAFAAGEAENQPLGVYALPAGMEGFFLPLEEEDSEFFLYLPLVFKDAYISETLLRVVHASPDAPPVDVWLDGSIAITSLAFGESTDFINLTPGTYNVQVVPSGATSPVVIEDDLTLERGTATTVAAVELLADIEPLVIVDELSLPAEGQAHVRFVHTSPDAPAVDIAVVGGPVLFENTAFKEYTDYLPVSAGTYDLEVRLAGTTTVVLTVSDVPLSEGRIYSVFATGLAAGAPEIQALLLTDR